MAETISILPFEQITPHLAIGAETAKSWHPISTHSLVVLVGVTGVGKSTLLNELAQYGLEYLLLPDRRDLTDQLIIRLMQAAEGLPIAPVIDRGQRFAYTRRYRQLYPGGMAHALSQLWIHDDTPALLVFDGLRGANEVKHAAATLPLARFVMLDAPDIVRLQRLLWRGDRFDRIQVATLLQKDTDAATFADLDTSEASAIFSPDEEATILGWLHNGLVAVDELRAKLQIVIEERSNYDPKATLDALRTHAPHAMLYVDTILHAPDAVAEQTIRWLNPSST